MPKNPALSVLQKEFAEKYQQYLTDPSKSVSKIQSNIREMEKYGINIEEYVQLGPFNCSDILFSLEVPRQVFTKNKAPLLAFIIDTFLERGFDVNLFGIDPTTGKVAPEKFTMSPENHKPALALSTWDKFWGFFGIETANAKTVKAFEEAKAKQAEISASMQKAAETKASELKKNHDFIQNTFRDTELKGSQYFTQYSSKKKEVANNIFTHIFGDDYDKNLLYNDIKYTDKDGNEQQMSLLSYITVRFSNLESRILDENFLGSIDTYPNGYGADAFKRFIPQIKTEIYALTGQEPAGLTEEDKSKLQQEKDKLQQKGSTSYLKENLSNADLIVFQIDKDQYSKTPKNPSYYEVEEIGGDAHFLNAKKEANVLFEGTKPLYQFTEYENNCIEGRKHIFNQGQMFKAFERGDYETAFQCAHENIISAIEFDVDVIIQNEFSETNGKKIKDNQIAKLKQDAVKSFNSQLKEPDFQKLSVQQKAACLMNLAFSNNISREVSMKGTWGKREKKVSEVIKEKITYTDKDGKEHTGYQQHMGKAEKKQVDYYEIKIGNPEFKLTKFMPDMYKDNPQVEKIDEKAKDDNANEINENEIDREL